MSSCYTCGGYMEHRGVCPACLRQERLRQQQQQQQQEQIWAEKKSAEKVAAAQEEVAYAQKQVAYEIKKTRETDTFFKQREYAEKGDCNAQNYIGCAFENGVGTKQDIEAAIGWWRKAEKNGSAEAGEKLQGIYSDTLEKANKGDDKAINFIIWAFENGVGTKQDIVAAAAWTNKFEKIKEERAKALAAAAAEADEKRRQELEWATNLKLADSGNSDAQFYIGSRKDSPQKKYLRQAAEQGHPAAQLLLAQTLSSDLHKQKYGLDDTSRLIHDADESIDWYKKYKIRHQDYNITENINKIEANLADILLQNINKTKENIMVAKKSFEDKKKIFLIRVGIVLFVLVLFCLPTLMV